MAKMGRPKGSVNLTSNKPFRDALRLALLSAGDDAKSLRRIAEKLAAKAAQGDIHAIKEVADRLDGKSVQGHGQDADLGPITVRWLKPDESEHDISVQDDQDKHTEH